MPSWSGQTRTRSSVYVVTETPCDDWRVSWRTTVLLPPCTLVGLVVFVPQKRSQSTNFFWGIMPSNPLTCACLRTHQHPCPSPQSQVYLPPPLLLFKLDNHDGYSWHCRIGHCSCWYKHVTVHSSDWIEVRWYDPVHQSSPSVQSSNPVQNPVHAVVRYNCSDETFSGYTICRFLVVRLFDI